MGTISTLPINTKKGSETSSTTTIDNTNLVLVIDVGVGINSIAWSDFKIELANELYSSFPNSAVPYANGTSLTSDVSGFSYSSGDQQLTVTGGIIVGDNWLLTDSADKLDIRALNSSAAVVFEDISLNQVFSFSTGTAIQQIQGATSPYLQIEDTTNNVQLRAQALNTSAKIGTNSTHALDIITDNTEAINIDESQLVDILDSSTFKIPVTSDSGRGSPGTVGRIFFNTDDGTLNLDDGSNFVLPDGTTT